MVQRFALMSPLSGPNFSPVGTRIRVVWRILQSVRKEVEENIGGGKGGARGLKPPLDLLRRMILHRNYLSWSGGENRDKDRDTLIEQSL